MYTLYPVSTTVKLYYTGAVGRNTSLTLSHYPANSVLLSILCIMNSCYCVNPDIYCYMDLKYFLQPIITAFSNEEMKRNVILCLLPHQFFGKISQHGLKHISHGSTMASKQQVLTTLYPMSSLSTPYRASQPLEHPT